MEEFTFTVPQAGAPETTIDCNKGKFIFHVTEDLTRDHKVVFRRPGALPNDWIAIFDDLRFSFWLPTSPGVYEILFSKGTIRGTREMEFRIAGSADFVDL